MNPERAAMLLAFKTENEVLTRREIMERASVTDVHKFQSMIDMRLFAAKPWGGVAVPREYFLTTLGRESREMRNVAENLKYG